MTRSGFIIVDKSSGVTSHDVVGKIRRILRTRKVGHGGTLDPMATGVLIVGVDRATRLLTYVIGLDKGYSATIQLGQSTVTDDAEGEITATVDPHLLTEDSLSDETVLTGLTALTGEIDQVPSSVSAIKVRGVRAYARVRAGEDIVLPARRVVVKRLDALAIRRGDGFIDIDIDVQCSSGTYIRALARDLGLALGVGGHLTALRRTAVGGFSITEAKSIEEIESSDDSVFLSLTQAVMRILPHRKVSDSQAAALAYGGPIESAGIMGSYAIIDERDEVIAIVAERGGKARPEAVLARV